MDMDAQHPPPPPPPPPPERVVPPSRRRDKPILSCRLCRRRKLKCDRQQPCKTCLDRGLSLSCTYAQLPSRPPTRDHKLPTNVHDRIDQLEKLVSTLLDARAHGPDEPSPSPTVYQTPSQSSHPSDETADRDEVPGNPDRVKLASDTTSYTSSGHWTSILDGIAELRDQLDQIPTTAQSRDPKEEELPGPDLLFGRQKHATKQELLASLPPRSEADGLLACYFDYLDMAPTLLHRPTFLREYNQFWERPFDTPVMWLGLLYSVFAIATRFQAVMNEDPAGDSNDPSDALVAMVSVRMDYYREKVVQSMILANYSKAPQYTIEALVQYFVTEYFRSRDSQFGTWLLVGMIVRVAFRMGYHREPSRFSNISVFEAEMRRRVWIMVVQIDLMSSSQFGLPRMIQPSMYDTREPCNLSEGDLDENMTELPTPRPETEFTTMLYTIIRNRVLEVFARIIDLDSTTSQPAYREVMDLDSALRNIHAGLPDSLKKIRVINFESNSDDTSTMRRLYLGLTMLKATIVLHRPYIVLARTDSRYEYSRLICIDAALEVLEYQKEIDAHARPGGRLWHGKWRLWSLSWRLSSIVNHDFLLATTVLALDLDKDLTTPMPSSSEDSVARVRFQSGQPTRAEIVEVLSNTYPIWAQASEKSREAQRVAAAVRYVLRKAGHNIESTTGSEESPSQSGGYENFAQQFRPHGIHLANPGPTPDFDFSSAGFAPQVPIGYDTMYFGNSFDWGGLEPNFATQNFEQNFRDSYIS